MPKVKTTTKVPATKTRNGQRYNVFKFKGRAEVIKGSERKGAADAFKKGMYKGVPHKAFTFKVPETKDDYVLYIRKK